MEFDAAHEDPAAINRFAQHVGIAADALEEIEKIPKQIHTLDHGDGMTQEVMNIWMQRWATGWQAAWEQLQEARAIVVANGRDASAFDTARTAAGDLYVDVAVGKAIDVGGAVRVTWRNVPTQTAYDAIAALKAAMPEVVIVKQAPIEVDLEPTGNKVLLIGGAVGVVGLIGYLVYRAFT